VSKISWSQLLIDDPTTRTIGAKKGGKRGARHKSYAVVKLPGMTSRPRLCEFERSERQNYHRRRTCQLSSGFGEMKQLALITTLLLGSSPVAARTRGLRIARERWKQHADAIHPAMLR
jgi:hypothetical protein